MAKRQTVPAQQEGQSGHTQIAYEGIRRMLFHNEVVPGQRISYRDLSERLGMSQTPVIQALKWLEFQQLVCHEPNRGYCIAQINLQEVEEIYDLRTLIEVDLLAVTFKSLNKTGLRRLGIALENHLKAFNDGYLYDRLLKDMEYHLTLASLSGRVVQQQTLKNLFDLLYLKYGAKFLFPSSMNLVDTDHQAIFNHIEKRNLEDARVTLTEHIRRVKVHVLHNVERVMAATRM
ncbi:MAG: GntR family transcriptional regulator [Syntrophobacteraceae bacterium]